MRRSEWALGATAWVLLSGAASAEPPPASVDQALADSMAQQCFLHSRANGWPPFTIAVVDLGGTLVLLRRQDGASSVTADAALLKARTATRVGASTQTLVALSQDSPTRDLLLVLQLTNDPGGVPVKAGNRIIGAIGVSGGAPDQDVGCATVAVAALTEGKK